MIRTPEGSPSNTGISAGARSRPTYVILGAILVAGALLLGFAKLAGEVQEGETTSFDNWVLGLFRTTASELVGPAWLQEAARDITALGSYAVLGLLLVGLVSYFLIARKRFEAAFLTASVLGGLLISNLLKIGFNRPRPDLANAPEVFSASFPSGHAAMSAVVFLAIGAVLAWWKADARLSVFFVSTALILTLLVGFTRVYLGVHFPTDVIAGWCVGSAWAIACTLAGQWLLARRTQKG